jgi:TonB family protein
MLWYHLDADVKLNFTVNELGGVDDISVAESSNPGFEDEAIKDLRQMRFQPAQLNGKPVARATSQVIHFDSPAELDILTRNRNLFVVTSSDGLPEAYRYDVAPKVRGTIEPVYPYKLMAAGEEGEATVAFTIGTDGRIHSTRVLKATRPEFGAALAAAVAQWRFDPALRKGKPVTTISSLHQEFDRAMPLPGVTAGDASDERAFSQNLHKHPELLVSAGSLDKPLHPFSRRPAVFPPDLISVKTGTSVVRVIIDDTGHARLPQVASASDPAFGYAAVQAAQFWRFDPPKSHGKPAMTIVDIPFNFAAPG